MHYHDVSPLGEACTALEDLIGLSGEHPDAFALRRSSREALRRQRAEEDGFSPISLRDWLDLAAAAGVPAIPSRVIASIPVDQIAALDDEGSKAQRDLFSTFAALGPSLATAREAAVRPMLRWDGCVSSRLRSAVSEGRAWSWLDATHLPPDDPRAFEIHVLHMPRIEVAIHLRPWQEALRIDGYPLEFRVYVRDGDIEGISNHHPRRPLAPSALNIALARHCGDLALKLARTQRRRVSYLAADGTYDPHRNTWTADFLIDADGTVLFIDGGPPPDRMASTDCFGTGPIRGLALSPR